MSQIKGLTDLPTELLLQIFDYVDSKEICSLLGTCTKFKYIIDDTEQLINKLTLYVQFPKRIESFAATMKKSTTPYRNIKITRSNKLQSDQFKPDEVFASISPTIRNLTINWHGYHLALNDALRAKINEANIEPEVGIRLSFNRNRELDRQNAALDIHHADFDVNDFIFEIPIFGGDYNRETNQSSQERAVTIVGIRRKVKSAFSQELINILRAFPAVSTLQLSNISSMDIPENLEPLQNLSSVRELLIKQCDLNVRSKILKSCVNLVKLENLYPFNNFVLASQRDGFEIFLVSLEKLKELSLEDVKKFFHDTHPEAKFKLHTLKLKNVFFTDQKAAEKFFKSQDQLVTVEMQIQNEYTPRYLQDMNPSFHYANILKILFENNKLLQNVKLHKVQYHIENCDFLKNVISPSVRSFSYHTTGEDNDNLLFKTLSRNFPNLERIEFNSDGGNEADSCTAFSEYRAFRRGRSLTIINSSVNDLQNVFVNNLEFFECSPGSAGGFIDDSFGMFFHRHRGIKKLVIGTKTRSSLYFFVSFNLCELIVNFLSELESITIFNFGEINKSVKLLCTLPKLRSLVVAKTQYEQFTKKTKDECEKRKLKLTPVVIETPPPPMNDLLSE